MLQSCRFSIPSLLKCSLWLTVIALVFSNSLDTQRVHAADSLRVLCYNIHYGQGTDGKYDVARLPD